jgi:glycosyltransferase 2 family protein
LPTAAGVSRTAPTADPLERPVSPPVAEAAGEPDASPPQSLGKRILRPETLASFAVAAAILFFALRSLRVDPAAIWANIRAANPWWFLAALVVWYATVVGRAARWRWMLANAGIDPARGYRLPNLAGTTEIVLLAWFANCVVPAKLGDAYRSWLLKQDSGASFSAGLGSVVAERLVDLVVLCLTMTAVGLAVFHGRLPEEAATTFVFGVILFATAIVGLAAMWFSRHAIQRRLPERVHAQYARLHDGMFGSLRRPAWLASMSAVLWLAEGTRVWLVAQSLDAHLAFPAAVFVALMGSLLTALPITPAGLGVVEAGTSAVMVGVLGMGADMAFSIVLLDRVVAYWSIVLVGIVLYVRRFGRDARRAAAAP